MVDKLFGHWKCQKDENMDELMKAINVGYLLRKVAASIASYEEIKREGDQWTVHITSTFRSSKLVFKLNEPFTETRLDGRQITAEFRVEGDKLVTYHTPISKDDIPCKYEREVLEDGRMFLNVTCTRDGKTVNARRYYIRYEP